jgi:hypothetical protein
LGVVLLLLLLLLLVLVVLDLWVGYIVRIAVYRGSGGGRGDRVSFVVCIGVVGKGVVEVCLRGRCGIAVVGEAVGVVVGSIGDEVVGSIVDIEVNVGVVVVLGINVKDGRGRGA